MGTPNYLMKPILPKFPEQELLDSAVAHRYWQVVSGCEVSEDPD